MFSPFNLFNPFRIGFPSAGSGYITVPVALTDADGVIFTDAAGVVLTYGTARVRPIAEPE